MATGIAALARAELSMTGPERRQFPRHDVRHPALVITRGFDPVACELANVCIGGMWLENVDSTGLLERLSQQPGVPLEVHVFLHHGGREKHSRVMTRVRRVDGTQVGVEFIEPMPGLVRQLTASPAPFGQHPVMAPDRRARLRRMVREQSPVLVKSLLETTLQEGAAAVRQALEAAARMPEINELKACQQLLRERPETLRRQFSRCWRSFLDLIDGHEAGPDRSRERRLPLAVVDEVLFEDWLELQVIASSLVTQHRNTLFQLNQALSQLARADIGERSNPLAPIPLCQCLQYAAFKCELGAQSRHLLYRAFRAALNEHWAPAMDALVDHLQRQGLRVLDMTSLPLNWPAPEKPKAPATATPATTQGPAAGTSALAPGPAQGLDRSSVLRLMELARSPGSAAGSSAPEPAGDLAERLRPVRSRLQAALSSPGASLSQALARVGEQDDALAGSLAETTRDRAELVDRLFAPLADEAGVPERLQEYLTQLKLPLFQMLVTNPAFLDRHSHPARDLFNDLMRLCLADRSSSRHLERTVAEIIDRLIHAEQLDDTLFAELGNRTRDLVQRQEQSFQRNAERIAKTLEGQHRLRQARLDIQQRLAQRLVGESVPRVLLDLLEVGWDQLMVLAELKEGAASPYLASLFSVVDQLQLWLAPEADDSGAAFERELESNALVQFIERELTNLGTVPGSREVLRRLSAELFEQAEPEFVRLAAYPPAGGEPAATPVVEPAGSRWATRARQLRVGDWISERQPDGRHKRMRLVWGGENVYRFVFLTAQGMHEVDYDFADLVARFEHGEVQRVEQEQVPFIDQGLYGVVEDLHREMTFRATHDPLTDAMQRHEFEKHLGLALARCQRESVGAGLVTLDIDQFSVVNATYGTAAGDAVLQECARLVTETSEEEGGDASLGRLGGNEFGVLVTPASVEQTLDLAERIRQRVRGHPFAYGEHRFPTTVSLSVNPISAESPDAGELLNRSNLALKVAKKAGGDRVEFVGRDQGQKAMLAWVSRIDRTLADGALQLRAQRIAPVASEGGRDYYEILLGLTDDQGREISPQPFIEAAEQYRRSARVDRWVVDHTFDWIQANPDTVAALGGLNINLSGASLSDDAFLAYLEERVRKGGVPANKLCFEVTETAAVANLHYVADFMMEMKRLSCRFALDDFGTGLSSYAYLQQLPVDFVKIDGVFIRGLADNLTNYAMVRSINELSHFLGTRTIAEYVEDMETLEALREIRVDFAQGFGIARPKPLSALARPVPAGKPAGA